jgi:Protein of unknown function (DUF2867)
MTQVTETSIPSASALHATLSNADFHDAYEAPLANPALTPIEIFLTAVRTTPHWIGTLMSIRNRIVRPLGLKGDAGLSDVSDKPAAAYRIGDRIGFFSIIENSADELIMGVDDHHLDVRVSVMKRCAGGAGTYVISSVVHVNNWLGHAYMVPVGRVHPHVVRAMMRNTVV